MRHVKVLGLAAILAATLSTAAGAAPMAIGSYVAPGEHALIEQVADGCGPGWHSNPYGECRPNRRPPPYYDRGYDRGYGYRPPPPPPEYGYYGRPRRFDY